MDSHESHPGTSSVIRLRTLAAITLSLLLLSGVAQAGVDDRLSAGFQSRSNLRADAPKGVSNNLAALFREQQATRRSLAATASTRGFNTSGGDVLTDVVLKDYADDLAGRIEAAGGIVRSISGKYLRAAVFVSNEAEAATIGALPEVRWVAAEYGAHRNVGSVTSRAVDALDVTPIAGSPNNLDGSGQRIGILSDSFARTNDVVNGGTATNGSSISGSGNSSPVTLRSSTPQNSGDLPDAVELRRDDASGSLIDEGAAMAELVHDLAPGADISFYTAFVSFGEFANGIDDLCSPTGSGGAGSTVVVDDIIYFSELMYQPDSISQAASSCVSSGIPYFSSAGNDGDTAYRHEYVDSEPGNDSNGTGTRATTTEDFFDWDPGAGVDKGLGVTIVGGGKFRAILQWNQPALSVPQNTNNGPEIDLDLIVIDNGGTVKIAESINDQMAADSQDGSDPYETVVISNTGSSPVTVQIAVDHWAGNQANIPQDGATPLEFRLVLVESTGSGTLSSLEYAGNGPAMYGHAMAAGAVSVAAVPWWESPNFDQTNQGSPEIDPEPFTSRGGGHSSDAIPFFFNPDGTFSSSSVVEPDLAAVDNNNTTFFGSDIAMIDGTESDSFPNFPGTSAAAPNAAAVAALLLEYSDGVAPADLQKVLEDTAIDVAGNRAAGGDDDVTGAGLVEADAALAEFPTADAGSDFLVETGSTDVALSGTSDLDVNNFAWTQQSGAMVTLNNANTDSPTFDAPASGDTLEFKLSVSDADDLTHADRVEVTIDETPVPDAGPDQTISTGSTVTLDGSGSSDDSGPVTYAWTQTGGTGVTLDDDTAEQPTFTAPGSADTLTFQLEVTDANGFTDTDTVTVNVMDNPGSDPLADAGNDVTVETGDSVELDGTGSSDADGPVGFDWMQIGGATVALNNAVTATPDFNAPSSVDTLTFRLQVTDDDGFTDTDTVTVNVQAPVGGGGSGGSSGGGGGGGSLGWLLLGLLGAGIARRRQAA